MAASGFTPISLYSSTTAAAVPLSANLVDGELAINITDGKLYYKDNGGVVRLLADTTAATPVTTISFGTTGLTPATATNGAVTVAGTLGIANGGTNSTTESGARTNLGASTLGSNVFTIPNPSAITFPRFNADNTVSALDAAAFRAAIGAGAGAGSVTSVSGTGTVNGITLTGTVTSSGSLTLGGTLSGVSLSTQVTGTLPIANGGTGETTRQNAMDALAGAVTSGQYLRGNGTDVVMSAIQAADVPTLNQNTTGSAATFTSTSQNSQFNSVGVGTAGSGTAGEIRATNNVTAFFSSDSRLKENIKDVDNALDKVCAIGSKRFDWTNEYLDARGGQDEYFLRKSDFGVIAQDVQAVFPLAVRTREDGTLAVDYEKLTTLAFGAIKELVKRVEALEAK
jgi:hypothetical protein